MATLSPVEILLSKNKLDYSKTADITVGRREDSDIVCTVKGMSSRKFLNLQKGFSKISKGVKEVDEAKLIYTVIEEASVSPDFKSVSFQEAVGATSSFEAIDNSLTLEEIMKLFNGILDHSGINAGEPSAEYTEVYAETKNS